MKTLVAGLAATLVCAASGAFGQFRDSQPAVIEPPAQMPAPDPRPAIIDAFSRDYGAAGHPRIVLFWAVAFDDNLDVDRRRMSRVDETDADSANSLDKTTAGPAGSATLRDGSRSSSKSRVSSEWEERADRSRQVVPFSARDAEELKQAFLHTMRQGGVRFVDRDVIVRTASADLKSKDLKTLETQAVAGRAAYVLEVLPVVDDRAPARAGFSIHLKQLSTGVEAASAYTHALPYVAPAGPARYVATPQGFALRAPLRPKPTIHDIGMALAIDTMRAIGPALAQAVAADGTR